MQINHKGKYYDQIARGYDELHKDEQIQKLSRIISTMNPEFLPKKEDSLLDVGCGSGLSTAPWDCKCIGFDPSIELIKLAQTNYPDKDFFVGMAENIPFPENSFDFVICLTAIHNFTNIKRGINEIKRVGKHRFILTALRKAKDVDTIQKLIMINFKINKILMEDRDIIFICELRFPKT